MKSVFLLCVLPLASCLQMEVDSYLEKTDLCENAEFDEFIWERAICLEGAEGKFRDMLASFTVDLDFIREEYCEMITMQVMSL